MYVRESTDRCFIDQCKLYAETRVSVFPGDVPQADTHIKSKNKDVLRVSMHVFLDGFYMYVYDIGNVSQIYSSLYFLPLSVKSMRCFLILAILFSCLASSQNLCMRGFLVFT